MAQSAKQKFKEKHAWVEEAPIICCGTCRHTEKYDCHVYNYKIRCTQMEGLTKAKAVCDLYARKEG